jgi:hypothetical protein
MVQEDELFPAELLNKRLVSAHNACGWKYEDIPQVVNVCRDSGLAILGGKSGFYLPDGICDLYWKKAHPRLKTVHETWQEYVEHSGADFLRLLKELHEQTDFVNEGVHSFYFLKEKKSAGVNIMDYLCFAIEVMTETRYFQFYSNLE